MHLLLPRQRNPGGDAQVTPTPGRERETHDKKIREVIARTKMWESITNLVDTATEALEVVIQEYREEKGR